MTGHAVGIPRKTFLRLSLLGSAAFLSGKLARAQAPGSPPITSPKPDPLAKEKVKEFVTKAHTDLESTKQLLIQQPGLLNACWDWGGGDFETGIEGAGHMGRRDIATFLLEHGARMNIFCAAMLGRIDIVKGFLTWHPELAKSKGPHGLQLLHHARQGGDEAKAVLDFLYSIGAE